jgi:hypothetical protein
MMVDVVIAAGDVEKGARSRKRRVFVSSKGGSDVCPSLDSLCLKNNKTMKQ